MIINQTLISEIFSEIKEETEKKIKSNVKRSFVKIEFSEFKKMIELISVRIMSDRGEKDLKFIWDESSEKMVKYLFCWITGIDFVGNLNRGILFCGGFGTGKTLILTAFCEIYNRLAKFNSPIFTNIWAPRFHNFYLKNGEDWFDKRPLFIDELGKEVAILNNYGNKTDPMKNILLRRYDTSAITFSTSNYALPTLRGFYKGTLADRLPEMFNVFEIKGESKRKK